MSLQPVIFGIYERYRLHYENLALTAVNQTLAMTAVPSGYIVVLTNMSFRYNGTAPNRVEFNLIDGAVTYEVWGVKPSVANTVYSWQGQLPMIPSEYIGVFLQTPTLNDDIYIDLLGYTMKVER
jgi:hypothetical protein